MSRKTRPCMQVDAQARPLPTSGDWTTFRGDYYPGTTNLRYGGFARPGMDTSDSQWQIFYCTYDALNNMTSILWPINATGAVSNDFEFIWNNRAAYTYV